MESRTKEVFFDKYCTTCAYKENKETEKPCPECLNYPYNINSHKPVRWKEKE